MTNMTINNILSINNDEHVDYSVIAEKRFEQAWNTVKNINIPEYDIHRVALHIIVTWHNLFESLQKDLTLEELVELKQNPRGWFVQTIHESIVWEVAVEDAIKEIEENNQEVWDIILSNIYVLYDSEFQKLYPESKQFVDNLYKNVYDAIANKVEELVIPEVIYYCDVAIKQLVKK